MTKNSSPIIIRRIFRISLYLQAIIFTGTYFFTNSPVCSIIAFFATVIAQAGFYIMIKTLDRYIIKRKGIGLFFVAYIAKLSTIALVFYLSSRISEQAVISFFLGITVMIMATLLEGGYQFLRSLNNGRTQADTR